MSIQGNYKVHSEQAAVAFVAKGWELALAIYTPEHEEAYEFLMRRISENLEVPSTEELMGVQRLYKIRESLTIHTKGEVVSPAKGESTSVDVKEGDSVVVIGEQSAKEFNVSTPIKSTLHGKNLSLLLREASKDEVKAGYWIWLIKWANKSQ